MFRTGIHFKLRDETDRSCLPEIQVGHRQTFTSQFLQNLSHRVVPITSTVHHLQPYLFPLNIFWINKSLTNHYNLFFLPSHITISHPQIQHKIVAKTQATPARNLSRLPVDFLYLFFWTHSQVSVLVLKQSTNNNLPSTFPTSPVDTTNHLFLFYLL